MKSQKKENDKTVQSELCPAYCGVYGRVSKANKYSSYLTSTHSNPQVIQTTTARDHRGEHLPLTCNPIVHTCQKQTLWDSGSVVRSAN